MVVSHSESQCNEDVSLVSKERERNKMKRALQCWSLWIHTITVEIPSYLKPHNYLNDFPSRPTWQQPDRVGGAGFGLRGVAP